MGKNGYEYHLTTMKKVLSKRKVKCEKTASKEELHAKISDSDSKDADIFTDALKSLLELEPVTNMVIETVTKDAAKKKNDDGKY